MDALSFARAAGRRLLKLRRSPLFSEFSGTWREASNSVSGYQSAVISRQVRDAIRAVRDGHAQHERDGVLFDEIEYSWPLLATIMSVGAEHHGRLRVLDFGGSLGSTYFQNRNYLSLLDDVRWLVVEQESFVEWGKKEFQTETLLFEADLSHALASFDANVVLCSSSLQYVASPEAILNQITESGARHLVLDRIPFQSGSTDLLTIQTVPPQVYSAQYPAWILSWPMLKKNLEPNWRLVSRFDTLEQPMRTAQGTNFFWQGAHFIREQAS